MPPFATGTGLFIVLRHVAEPASLAIPLVVAVNALMTLPIACRLLEPALMQVAKRHGRLAASLGIEGRDRWRLVTLPLLRKPLALAFATAFAISLGDLGVAALFGAGDAPTLPVLLYAYLGSYQIDRAAAVALLLTLLIAGVFALCESVARGTRHV